MCLALVLACLALGWFVNLDHRKLIKADEGRYGEIPREMVASGDWLTPRMNGFKYFEKPPLQYWATATAYTLFGVSEWTTRLWTALTALAGIALVWLAGNRAFGPPVGRFAALALGGMSLYQFVGSFVTLDMGVSFFMSLAVFSVMLAQIDSTPERERRLWMLLGWAGMALAVLSKGLIGLVLPIAAGGMYILLRRDWAVLGRLYLFQGGLLFLAIAAPWFIAVSLANPEFFDFFFIQEHFRRFLTKQHGRYQPAWYFIPVLVAGTMPWLLVAAAGVWKAVREREPRRFNPAMFLTVWCAIVFLFFSGSSSKLASYVLPIFPALALLAGRYLPAASRGLLAVQAAIAVIAGVATIYLSGKLIGFAARDLPADMLAAYAPWVQAAGLALALIGTVAFWTALRREIMVTGLLLTTGSVIYMQLVITGHEALSPLYSAYHTIDKVRPLLKPGVPFYAVNSFDHTMPFYLGRTVTMVSYRDELAVPIGWEPEKFIPDLPAFAEAWKRDREAYAFFAAKDFEEFRVRYDIPVEVLASDPRRVLVRKPVNPSPKPDPEVAR